jgi:uncharacterized protein (DUF2147 family)
MLDSAMTTTMKLSLVLGFWMLTLLPAARAQVTGLWTTVDDRDGRAKSVVEIYERNGRYHGKIVRLLEEDADTVCPKCPGDRKGKPLVGMHILTDLEITPDGGRNGQVLDPESGSVYSCYIQMLDPGKLKLRGYIGAPAFGRTQVWTRSR